MAYLRWRFAFGPAARRREIEEVSRVRFVADGRVEEHIDYRDPAAQLYEAIPVLGSLLRRRLSATGNPVRV
ncbi:MAG: hypothetical protein ACFCVA_08020 [Gammaproteobacteria bacterium]